MICRGVHHAWFILTQPVLWDYSELFMAGSYRDSNGAIAQSQFVGHALVLFLLTEHHGLHGLASEAEAGCSVLTALSTQFLDIIVFFVVVAVLVQSGNDVVGWLKIWKHVLAIFWSDVNADPSQRWIWNNQSRGVPSFDSSFWALESKFPYVGRSTSWKSAHRQ